MQFKGIDCGEEVSVVLVGLEALEAGWVVEAWGSLVVLDDVPGLLTIMVSGSDSA
jgi:hypothetical protein